MNATNNYFKSNGFFFFFVDSVLESIEDAFRAAELVGAPAIFRPAEVAGPWDHCAVIGHRPRPEILRDLNNTDRAKLDEFLLLEDELHALHATFLDVGRMVPPMAIAA